MGSIPGQGTKIPQAAQNGPPKEKKNFFFKNFICFQTKRARKMTWWWEEMTKKNKMQNQVPETIPNKRSNQGGRNFK